MSRSAPVRVALAGVVAAATALAVWPLAGPAGAATSVIEVGWWTRSPFSSAPDGGLAVGDAPDGTTAVGAVRLDLGAGITAGTVTLDEADGFAQEVAVIVACRADEAWTAETGGDLDDAPEPKCGESPLELEPPDGGGTTWTIDVKPIVGNSTGPVTVMFLPGDDADLGGTVGLGYEVRFEAPTFTATEVPSSSPTTAPRTTSGPTPSNPTPATTPPAAGPRSTPTRTPRATPPRSSTPTTTPSDTTTTSAPTTQFRASGIPPSPGDDTGAPWGRFGLFALLATGIGAGAGGAHYVAADRLGLGRPPDS